MQITRGGVTVQPLTFQFGVVMLSGGGTGGGSGTGGGTGTLTGGSTGDIGGGGGGGGGIIPALGSLLLGLATLGGIAASTPPPAVPPAVTAGPAVTPPSAPVAVASTPDATPPVAGGGRSTPAPIVLAASAAQTGPAAANTPKQGPGLVLPYTGANLWLPFAAGSGFLGFGIWLRRFAERLTGE